MHTLLAPTRSQESLAKTDYVRTYWLATNALHRNSKSLESQRLMYRITSQQRFLRYGGAPSLTPTSTTNTLIHICPSPRSKPHPPPIQSNLHHSYTKHIFLCTWVSSMCHTWALTVVGQYTPIWCFLACCAQPKQPGRFFWGQVSSFRWIHCFYESMQNSRIVWWIHLLYESTYYWQFNSCIQWIHVLRLHFIY